MFIPLHDANALKNIRLQYVTLILIALNIIIWVITATPQITDVSQANAYYYSYGFVPAVINDVADLPPDLIVLPETASYVTYAFLHGGFMHLAGNMLFLWVFGDNVEDAMGHLKYLVFYLVCAAAGAFAHNLTIPNSEAPLIGASGAASGIVGAYLMLHPKVKVWVLVLGRIPLRLSAMWVLGAWIAFQVYNYVTVESFDVSWAAHIGGILAGVLLVPFFKRRDVPLFDRDLPKSGTSVPVTGGIQEKERNNPVESPHKWGRGSD
ncbi:MAG: rhomboid family intramembrane serine protease [Pseudomonadota bacterium]